MAANPKSSDNFFAGKNGRVFYADPISWISPDADNSSNEDDSDYVITTPTKRIVRPSTSSTKKSRGPKKFPAEWIDRWEVEERSRSNGIRSDKFYHHKKEGFTLRSFKDVEKYEKDGTMPERKRKGESKGKEIINDDEKEVDGNVAKKKKQAEEERIRVEKFLAESYNNLLHWFDTKA